MAVKFSNYASTVLASSLTASTTLITVSSAASFPTLVGGDWFYVTLIDQPSYSSDANPPAQREVVKVTAVAGNVLTVARGLDGTVGQIWAVGTIVELRVNAAGLNDIPTSAATLTYTSPSSGGVSRLITSKLSDWLSVKDFGAIGDGASDDTSAIVTALAAAAAQTPPGCTFFPAGTYKVTSTITLPAQARLLGSGQQSPSKIAPNGSFAAFTVSAGPATFQELYFLGSNNGGFTAQEGILVNGVNLCTVAKCYFTNLYNSIHYTNVSYYNIITDCTFFDCINAHVITDGAGAAGVDLAVTQCKFIPTQGNYGLSLSNLGSIVMSDVTMSPAAWAQNALRIVTVATNYGGSFFNNIVFEASVKEAVRLDGTAPAPVTYCFFNNCWFLQSGSFDSVNLQFTHDIYFSNCYFSGLANAIGFNQTSIRTYASNCTLIQVGDAFHGYTGAIVTTLSVSNCSVVNVGSKCINFAALTAGNISGVTILGGDFGANATPVVFPASSQGKCSIFGTGPGVRTVIGSPTDDGVSRLQVEGDVQLKSVGNGLRIKQGSNATVGQATLSSGSVVVNNTTVSTNHMVLVTHAVGSGTLGTLAVSIIGGVSFTITSTNAADVSIVNWMMVYIN